MSADPQSLHPLLEAARQALRRGDREETRRLAEQIVRFAPDLEEGWLILSAVAGPQESLTYARRALAIRPDSPRAQRAVAWAQSRVEGRPGDGAASQGVRREPPRWLWGMVGWLGVLMCAVLGLAMWSASQSFALMGAWQSLDVTGEGERSFRNFQPAYLPKPTYAPLWTSTAMPAWTAPLLPTLTATLPVTDTPQPTETEVPTERPAPTEPPTFTATPTFTEPPGMLEAYIVPDTPTPIRPTPAAVQPAGNGARWILVDLSEQRLYAYEGDVVVNVFVVSTGVAATPTVTGSYRIYARYRYADMRGPGYYLKDVPYVMYFYKSYGIHGTYWHNNFGRPMSRGCVNMRISDAEWLYHWSTYGTLVVVQR